MGLIRGLRVLYEKKEMIWNLSINDFKKRFVGSYFGVFWMFLQPIVSILIYHLVFEMGFKSNPVENMPYILWLFPGIVPWFFFNEAVMNGVDCLRSYQHLVKKMVFPVEIIPILKIVSSLFLHFIFIGIMIIAYLICGQKLSVWWFQVVYYLVCNIVLITGIVYLTSAIQVFVKDTNQIVNILLQFGFWLAPIMWDESIMPEFIRPLLRLNPFTYIVNGFRDCFVFHIGFWENISYTMYFWIFTGILFVLGINLFRKLKPHFVDVL